MIAIFFLPCPASQSDPLTVQLHTLDGSRKPNELGRWVLLFPLKPHCLLQKAHELISVLLTPRGQLNPSFAPFYDRVWLGAIALKGGKQAHNSWTVSHQRCAFLDQFAGDGSAESNLALVKCSPFARAL